MTEEQKPHYPNDEIDLFELIETLWKGKVAILAFAFISFACGLAYVQLAQPKYSVTINYSVNLHLPAYISFTPIETKKDKERDYEWITERVLNELPVGWTHNPKLKQFSLTTLAPEEAGNYEQLFKAISESVSANVLKNAQADVNEITAELPETLQSTEAVAQQMLNAKKIVRTLGDGINAIDFRAATISQVAPKKSLVIALSVVLGGMLGVMFVLIRSAICSRKKNG